MLKFLIPVSRFVTRAPLVQNVVANVPLVRTITSVIPTTIAAPKPSLLSSPQLFQVSSRNLIKLGLNRGRCKSVKAVRRRFYRLHWGAWIRTMCGRHKRLWKKSGANKRRLRQHVMCNASQSYLLDKMAGPFWTKRRYYVDDPYEPYHTREEYPLSARKPKVFVPPSGTVPNC
ncbi:39S ribosomal protein L35, mitochondrial-like Protein [Tribolium castaneum]|uniref:Large ribosomal subunit protein bL35m n=1 Tax=Tribolium castaneum TaxID=7070 RepID=D6WZV7_TRICA|nr:39S ribosomal protein L35, mitochondrial-like Protein [Tribolium castaneum]